MSFASVARSSEVRLFAATNLFPILSHQCKHLKDEATIQFFIGIVDMAGENFSVWVDGIGQKVEGSQRDDHKTLHRERRASICKAESMAAHLLGELRTISMMMRYEPISKTA
jgi:hypothetical protein